MLIVCLLHPVNFSFKPTLPIEFNAISKKIVVFLDAHRCSVAS